MGRRHRKHLAETSHGLIRGQAVLISLQNDLQLAGGQNDPPGIDWGIVLSGEGHGSGKNGACLRLAYPFTVAPVSGP